MDTARLILAAAESGAAAGPLWRGAALLAALEQVPLAQIADWPVAARDAALLDWRARLIGRRVEARATCPTCGEALEFTLDTPLPAIDQAAPGPSTATIAAALATDDPAGALAAFAGIDRHEALAEVALHCPECAGEFTLLLDPASLLQRELATAATRLTGEVIILARAFGWSEDAILSLPPSRRATYLAAVQ